MNRYTSAVFFIVGLLATSTVAAQTCPQPRAEERSARRSLAKEWFLKGEQASKVGDDLTAIRAFQCSMSLIPHGFTAYNLAQVAQRLGDLELAITSYSQYLTLLPQAEDKDEIQKTIDNLKDRLAKVAETTAGPTALAAQNTPLVPATEPPPSPEVLPSPPMPSDPKPMLTTNEKPPLPSEPASTTRFGVVSWVMVGTGVAFVGTGVGFNLWARSKKATSDRLFDEGDEAGSNAALSDAKTYAYTSYGLFAAGVAASAVGITLGLWPKSAEATLVSYLPGGGMMVSLRGRYE